MDQREYDIEFFKLKAIVFIAKGGTGRNYRELNLTLPLDFDAKVLAEITKDFWDRLESDGSA